MLPRFLVLWLCFGVVPAVLLFRRGDVPGALVQLLEEEQIMNHNGVVSMVSNSWVLFLAKPILSLSIQEWFVIIPIMWGSRDC